MLKSIIRLIGAIINEIELIYLNGNGWNIIS